MKRLFLSILYILLIGVFDSCTVYAQTVSTFVTGSGLNGPDGFAIDTAGNLYVANWGGGSGNNVLKITPGGTVTTYASGFSAPDGLVFDVSGNLYVSNYSSGVINKVSPAGVTTVFASGFSNPSALVFDGQGNLYVSNYGGNTVSKITPEGVASTFASGFNAPLGLAFDSGWNLYVSNYNSGVINKVSPEGVVTVFATIPNSPLSRAQYLLFGRTGNLYMPAYGHHKIYKITPAGVVTVLTGTGTAGGNNGSLDSATFNGPNSIAMNKAGEIFVSEYNANRIRKISGVEFPASIIKDNGRIINYKLFQNYPNPFNPSTSISFSIKDTKYTVLKVFDVLGKEVSILVNEILTEGNYKVDFNAYGLSSGIYTYRLEVYDRKNNEKSFCDAKKMVIIK